MPQQRGFDEQMLALDALSERPLGADDIALLQKLLSSRNNFIVARVAKLIELNQLPNLQSELIAAFRRFFINAEKTDPQCWAKNAIAKALHRLGCVEREVFLPGIYHRQLEPSWGGKSDSAGTLRATCAHALVGCDGVTNQDLLLLLTDLLVDPDKGVRKEVVRAIAQTGELALPVLRLRALIPGEEAEVMAACFAALLLLDRAASIAFVARFLQAGDDAAVEAAFALAETHCFEALQALMEAHQNPPRDAESSFTRVLLDSIAMTRLPQAIDHLVTVIERDERDAPLAIEALAKVATRLELRERLMRTVETIGSPRLSKVLLESLSR